MDGSWIIDGLPGLPFGEGDYRAAARPRICRPGQASAPRRRPANSLAMWAVEDGKKKRGIPGYSWCKCGIVGCIYIYKYYINIYMYIYKTIMYITDFRPGSKAMDCCSEKQRLLKPMLFGTLNRKGLLSHTQMGKNIWKHGIFIQQTRPGSGDINQHTFKYQPNNPGDTPLTKH